MAAGQPPTRPAGKRSGLRAGLEYSSILTEKPSKPLAFPSAVSGCPCCSAGEDMSVLLTPMPPADERRLEATLPPEFADILRCKT